jgi:hypothetical protein
MGTVPGPTAADHRGGNGKSSADGRTGIDLIPLPEIVAQRLRRISVDKWTGNLTLHVKDGRILALRAEEVTQVTI